MDKRKYETAGVWDSEPDSHAWMHGSGLRCWLVRNSLGAWLGYVSVLADHPFYGVTWQDLPDEIDESVHGGVTYSDFHPRSLSDVEPLFYAWFIGFDCAHGSDIWPGAPVNVLRAFASLPSVSPTYKTYDFAKAQTDSLAQAIYDARNLRRRVDWSTQRDPHAVDVAADQGSES